MLKTIDDALVVSFQAVHRTICINQSGFNFRFMSNDLTEMILYIFIAHSKADEPDRRQVLLIEIPPPAKRDIAALNNEVLSVLNRGLNDFPYDRPQVSGKSIIVLWRQTGIAAADKAHFQMIDRQIRVMVLFEHLLSKNRFSGVRRSSNQDDHNLALNSLLTFTKSQLVRIWTKAGRGKDTVIRDYRYGCFRWTR